MYLLIFLYLMLIVMISVGFYTLLERKVLSYIQLRKGPNKLGILGLLQPFSDGVSLFSKELLLPMNSNLLMYLICPFLSLLQSLFLWCLFPMYFNMLNMNYGFLFFLCCSCISVYGLVICGWSSNSIYSMLGSIRSISQAISYEVSMSLILFSYFMLIESYNFFDFYKFQLNLWFLYCSIPIFLCWSSCCFAETNRSPFDFSEGESELVSGFNIEYSSGSFAVLFISEYASMIFMSMLTCLVFLGGDFYGFFFYLKLISYCFIFIWVRSCLPRYRYDKLMYLSWKCFLPLSLNYCLFFFFLSLIYIYHFFLLS